ncbi:hypothetical protein J4401_05460 [Candidatus Woesearchaeota archaeon]|nr:hypothetical protein [Candidatus Woesearchaeota archaeon]
MHVPFDPLDKKSVLPIKFRNMGKSFSGSSPSPFVGRFGYPEINLGILAPPEISDNAWELDAPKYWASNNYTISDIVSLRSSLINSSQKVNIRDKEKLLSIAQQVGMASRPVDLEINLKEKPIFRLNSDSYLAPRGPNARLENASITSNPHIDSKVDKVCDDTDLKASEALIYLYSRGFDENFLSKLLSVGSLGIGKNRKLVPSRWSITASDDTIGKNLIQGIKENSIAEHQMYYGSYLGNHYFMLFFSGAWKYELFEAFIGSSTINPDYMTDYEPYDGRKKYAEQCAGGYYSVRLAIAEKLKEMKKQASAIAVRIITKEYNTPLGVWVTREASRKALSARPLTFGSKELMLQYLASFLQSKFGCVISGMLSKSRLLQELKQKKIMDYAA